MSRETSARRHPFRNGLFSRANRVVLTGFEPFGGSKVNSSQRVAEALDGVVVAKLRIRSVVLPCRFGAAAAALHRTIRQHRPALVICLGLAEKRRAITPECLARNRVDARIPDNAGRQPRGQPVREGGPVTLRSGLPVAQIAAAMRAAGLPARVSRSAGRFVCNEVFYRLMDSLPPRSGIRAGFIHLPLLRVRGHHGSGLSLTQLVRAIRIAIEVSAVAAKSRKK